MNKTRTLAILIFDDVEVLDFCGPFEVFSVANRFTDPPAFNVLTVAEMVGPVLTRGGQTVSHRGRAPVVCLLAELQLQAPGQEARLAVQAGPGSRHCCGVSLTNPAW